MLKAAEWMGDNALSGLASKGQLIDKQVKDQYTIPCIAPFTEDAVVVSKTELALAKVLNGISDHDLSRCY